MGQHVIREARSQADLEQCKYIATMVWGNDSSCSIAQMSVHVRYGGIVLLALKDGEAVGFTLSFPARLKGQWVLWSHETAVLSHVLHHGIGYDLKMTQRRLARDLGYSAIAWTFDPLISRNAHFNLNKLGTKVVDFIPNCYGVMEGDPLNEGVESDRFLAFWDLSVEDRDLVPPDSFSDRQLLLTANKHAPLLHCAQDYAPILHRDFSGGDACVTEVPGDMQDFPGQGLRADWVHAMRLTVTTLHEDGYQVRQFMYDATRKVGRYIWERAR